MDPILIVDDEPDNLEALRRLLRNHYEVTTADSSIDGLKQVMTRGFHVIISDQRMPDMTGVEFFEKVKTVQPAAVRVLLTGYTDIDSVIGAINRGQIYRYIAKPWDPEDLKITLKQANDSYKLQRELEIRNRELSAANEKLSAANKELERLDAAKARFLSLVSHELNTPLTVLTSYVPLLSEKSEVTPKATKAIRSATERLSEIVGEIVEYVSTESKSSLHVETLELHRLLSDCIAKRTKAISDKKIRLQTDLNNIVMSGDRNRLALALDKLLVDFIDRAPVGTPLVIDCEIDAQTAVVSLSRKGEALANQAFEPLDYAADPLKHTKNFGLGLALCRSIVEAHGGRIGAFSTSDYPAVVEIRLGMAG